MNIAEALARMPQKGDMCLIDEVLNWDAQHIECMANHTLADMPLLHDSGLSQMFWIEFGAQAGALHSLLSDNQAMKSGLMVSLKQVYFYPGDAQQLYIKAKLLTALNHTKQYTFTVCNQEQSILCSGIVLVTHQF